MDNVQANSGMPPVDFAKMDDAKVLEFLVDNFDEFSDEPKPDEFPRNIRLGLKSKHLVVLKREHAFAIVAKNMGLSYKPKHAEIVFLYTSPSMRGRGIAGELIEQIKQDESIGAPIKLLCYGDARHKLFASHGFKASDVEEGMYDMWFPAEVASNPPIWQGVNIEQGD